MSFDYPLIARMVISRLPPNASARIYSILYIRRVPETGEIRMHRTEIGGKSMANPDMRRLAPSFSSSPDDAVQKIVAWLTEQDVYNIHNLDEPIVEGWPKSSLDIIPTPLAPSYKAQA